MFLTFNLKKLVSYNYLFTLAVIITRSDKLFFVLGASLVILAIVFKIAALYAPTPVDKILRNKFYSMFLCIGLLEILWFAARYENVMFFGTHFVALIILLIGLLWFVRLVWSIVKNYRADKNLWEKEQVRLKYLPK